MSTQADHLAILDAARYVAAEASPYLSAALYRLRLVTEPGLGTLAVDAQWRCYVDPDTVAEWGVDSTAAVLEHEVGHLLREHFARSDTEAVTAATARLANVCQDAEINADLEVSRSLPGDYYTPARLGQPDGMPWEVYYRALLPQMPPDNGQPTASPGEVGCGSCADGQPRPYELPGDDAQAPAMSPTEAEAIRVEVATAITQATSHGGKGRGTVPAGMARWAADTLRPPTVDWRVLLRSRLRRAVRLVAGAQRSTWRRADRRDRTPFLLPGTATPTIRVAAVVDTSGSMSDGDLAAVAAEAEGVLQHRSVAKPVTVWAVDAAASAPQRVRSMTEAVYTGGGGTDMRVGIAAADQRGVDLVVVFTDGGTPWPDPASVTADVLVVLVLPEGTDPARYLDACPFPSVVVKP